MKKQSERPAAASILETVIQAHLKKNYAPKKFRELKWNDHDARFFASGVRKLHHFFTVGAATRRRDYLSFPELRSAYLAYFLPVNAAKTAALLRQHQLVLPEHLQKKSLRIMDVGSGPLTMTLGFLQALAPQLSAPVVVNVDALEQNARIVAEGRELLIDWLTAMKLEKKIQVNIRHISGDLSRARFSGDPVDFFLLGNVLGELTDREAQQEFVARLGRRCADPRSIWFFLEPSAKRVARDLQALRDALIAQTGQHVIAPCLHQKQCPLNQTAKGDWCHFYQDWDASPMIRLFDQLCGLKKTYLAYSYLCLGPAISAAVPFSGRDFRAISNRMRDRSGETVVGCGPAGRWHFTRRHAEGKASRDDFDSVQRGDVFSVKSLPILPKYELDGHRSVRAGEVVRRCEEALPRKY